MDLQIFEWTIAQIFGEERTADLFDECLLICIVFRHSFADL